MSTVRTATTPVCAKSDRRRSLILTTPPRDADKNVDDRHVRCADHLSRAIRAVCFKKFPTEVKSNRNARCGMRTQERKVGIDDRPEIVAAFR